MPQVNYTPIQLYRSNTPGATPSAGLLQDGELALNYADGKLFYKDGAGVVKTLVTPDTDTKLVPAGATMFFAMAGPPTGWLVANGAAVSRTAYANLFIALGTLYGAGDGSTTFNLPDLRDRMAIGSGSSYALAATGGSKDSVLIAHQHYGNTYGAGGHAHSYSNAATNGYYVSLDDTYMITSSGATGSTSSVGDHQHSFLTDNAGSSNGVGANLPPYIGLLPCIKY